MKILAFSDWRVQSFDIVEEIITEHQPDAILYAGDDLDRFNGPSSYVFEYAPSETQPLAFSSSTRSLRFGFEGNCIELIKVRRRWAGNDLLRRLKAPFFCVNGNDDRIIEIGEERFIQVDGWLPLSATFVPLTIDLSFGPFEIVTGGQKVSVIGVECEHGLNSDILRPPAGYSDIYLSHVPPYGVLDLSVRFGEQAGSGARRPEHIGSRSLRTAIEKYQPRIVVCGHSHIWGGYSQRVGDTLVVNLSCQDELYATGNYAIIETDDWTVQFGATGRPWGHIRGMGEVVKKLRRLAFTGTVRRLELYESTSTSVEWASQAERKKAKTLCQQLSGAMHEAESAQEVTRLLKRAQALGIDVQRIIARVESLESDHPSQLGRMTLDPEPQCFVDVETGLARGEEPGRLWLVGLWYRGEIQQFLIPSQTKEFIGYLKRNRIQSLASWSAYDHKALRPLLQVNRLQIEYIDALQRAANCLIWHTYSLHDLFEDLFEDQPNELISGRLAGLYADHLIIPRQSCRHCPPRKRLIEQIQLRNRTDLVQMVEICRLLRTPETW